MEGSTCYCTRLRRCANRIAEFYDDTLSPVGLTAGQFSLLRNLEKTAPCSVSELAKAVGLERTTLVRTLKPLEKNGFVCNLAKEGQRKNCLVLSTDGLKAVREGEKRWKNAQKKMRDRIGEEKIDMLYAVIDDILEWEEI